MKARLLKFEAALVFFLLSLFDVAHNHTTISPTCCQVTTHHPVTAEAEYCCSLGLALPIKSCASAETETRCLRQYSFQEVLPLFISSFKAV